MKVTHLPYAPTLVDLLLMLSYLRIATCEAERCITPTKIQIRNRELLPCQNFIIVTFATLFDVV